MIPSPFENHIAFKCITSQNLSAPLSTAAKRKAEFQRGRTAAQYVLEQLGFTSPPPVLKGRNNRPLWPPNVRGSITHAGDFALAAAGLTDHIDGIGIDLERLDRKLRYNIAERIASPEERLWINADKTEQRKNTLLLFSAKESIYKAFSPLAQSYLGFRQVLLQWDDRQHSFQGKLLVAVNSSYQNNFCFTVGCVLHEEYVLTYTVLPRRRER